VSGSRTPSLFWRQLTANRAFVLRRTAAEALALALARLGTRLPGAAALAAWIDPRLPDARRVLAGRAAARGRADAAAHHLAEADRLARNTSEISFVSSLRNTLAWRRASVTAGGASPDVAAALAEGRIEAAADLALAAESSLGRRIDGLLEVARAARAAGDLARCTKLIAEAERLDGGRADVFREKGEAALASGQRSEARRALDRAVALDPRAPESLALLGDAWGDADPALARRARFRALERCEDPALEERLVLGLTPAPGVERETGGSVRLTVVSAPVELDIGQRALVEIEVGTDVEASLLIVEPLGAGVSCEPRGRIPALRGTSRLRLEVTANRADLANAGRPWSVRLFLTDGCTVRSSGVSITVPERRPGTIFYLITEDHEVYDERETTEAPVVRTTLVDKSRLAEQIANRVGAPWTHMVDVGSLGLVRWAADVSSDASWQALQRDCEEHLVEAVEQGNDLGLHIHGFHVPGWDGFVHEFDASTSSVTSSAAFLEARIPQRAFWARGFPALGDPECVGSRAWVTWQGIGLLEALGRLGDPSFRVTLFRAGSLDYGDDARERSRSTQLLRRLEILADTDVPKPRLYPRLVQPTPYPVAADIREVSASPAQTRLLEIRAEFNIEGDFLSDTAVLNRYVDLRVASIGRSAAGPTPGVHIICCMSHDKLINWRMGRRWDSLDPSYGDWCTIREHLQHVSTRHPEVTFATPARAVLAWWDYHAPELIAWREREIVVVSEAGAAEQEFRYPLRLLGEGIPVSPERPHTVTVTPPAWLQGRIHEAWIERDRARHPARRLPVEPGPLEFDVDDRSVSWELVVRAAAGDGVTVERLDADGRLVLRSRHPYRRASLEIPVSLSAEGRRRRVDAVRFQRLPDGGFGAVIDGPRRSG
jgi:tetratricopeptide (TPR) repeat protein